MFGMSNKEFWEDDPQLYWSYRTFYLKKQEYEQQQQIEYIKYNSWLNGNLNSIAHSIALNNAFSKTKKVYPKIDECFEKEKNKKLSKKEVNIIVQEEYNAWARY